jgi:hypothetical protein
MFEVLKRPLHTGAAASRSRPMSSLALITSWRRCLARGLTCHTGLSLLFEVGVTPPHDGIRRMGRRNLWGALGGDRVNRGDGAPHQGLELEAIAH